MDPASLALAALVWHGSTEIAAGRGGADGAVAIVNSSFKEGESSRVWLIRANLRPGS